MSVSGLTHSTKISMAVRAILGKHIHSRQKSMSVMVVRTSVGVAIEKNGHFCMCRFLLLFKRQSRLVPLVFCVGMCHQKGLSGWVGGVAQRKRG